MARWEHVLGADHIFGCPVSGLAQVIAQIVAQHENDEVAPTPATEPVSVIGFTNEISW